jgi:hypothetical protein
MTQSIKHLNRSVATQSPGELAKRLWDQVDKIQVAMGISNEELLDLLKLSRTQYQVARDSKSELSIHQLKSLADCAGLSIDRILSGQVDYSVLAEKAAGEKIAITERYSVGAHRRCRTSINLLQYIETIFQAPKDLLLNPERWISIHFLNDICSYLEKMGANDATFRSMGSFSVVSNFSSPLGKSFASIGVLPDLIKHIFLEVNKEFENNACYDVIGETATSITVSSVSNKDVAEELKVAEVGSPLICLTRAGTFSSIPAYLGLPYANVNETSCVHQNDARCVFEIDFSTSIAAMEELRANSGKHSWN